MEARKSTNTMEQSMLKVPLITKIAYGSGDVACNISFGVISTLLTLFYTDYVGVSAATIGLVMLISRVFDGVSDVIMGYIVSHTNSKWGQSRPWIGHQYHSVYQLYSYLQYHKQQKLSSLFTYLLHITSVQQFVIQL